LAANHGELAQVREAEEQVQALLAASLSQATEIAEKERQLAGLRETVNVMKRRGGSKKQAMQA
jgi:hypothetical protein